MSCKRGSDIQVWKEEVMKPSKILTLTMNPSLDKSVEVDHVVPEDKLRCGQPEFDPGGGGINVARAVNEMGESATALFLAGGWSGDRLAALLDNEGVSNYRISITQETRQNLIVFETATGRQFRFGMPGPELGKEDGEQVLEWLSDMETVPQFLVATGSLPPGISADFYGKVIKTASQRGVKVIVDASDDTLKHALSAHPYMIKPNLRELAHLAGKHMENDEEIERAARQLIDAGGCDICMVSLGAGGALWVSGKSIHRLHTPTVRIRSKVGAGDCTVAGIVIALSRGWTEKRALALGVSAGAAAVMTPGTQLCRREDVDRLFTTLEKKGNTQS